ncbi:uncharacterized protein TNCV_4708361 [Trichonephila clavipes]|nr:uncharacterized protein TNCV_4708361 [Trichonephila clavipes]
MNEKLTEFNSDVSLEAVDQRAPNNSINWWCTTEGDISVRRSTPAPHGGELPYSFLHAVSSPLVYCYRCTNVGFVNSSTSAVPWIACKDESRFNLWDHDGRIRVRCYVGERCLPECVIVRHSGLTSGVMVCGAISYHERSNVLPIEGNLNSNRYVREVLQPEVVPFLQGSPGAIFKQDNASPHVAKLVSDFC